MIAVVQVLDDPVATNRSSVCRVQAYVAFSTKCPRKISVEIFWKPLHSPTWVHQAVGIGLPPMLLNRRHHRVTYVLCLGLDGLQVGSRSGLRIVPVTRDNDILRES